MNSHKLIFLGFVLMASVQLFVPGKMILDREDVLNSGQEYKFLTAPIDPNDPFRGKYITLSYKENRVSIKNEVNWERNETVYVNLTKDELGFARIQSVSKEAPLVGSGYLKTTISYVSSDGSNELSIDYPFDRYYMEESKAQQAESIHRESLRDKNQVTYALVSIKDGDAVLKDVFIDATSIREMVKARQQNER